MRTYYIFNINNHFAYVYKNKPYKVYKVLEEIYTRGKYDVTYTYKLYDDIAKRIDKNILNEYIYYNYRSNFFYRIYDNIHIYNNREYSKLTINNCNIKLKTNVNFPIFLKNLTNYSDNLFVCDFINKDYFWLNTITSKQFTRIN